MGYGGRCWLVDQPDSLSTNQRCLVIYVTRPWKSIYNHLTKRPSGDFPNRWPHSKVKIMTMKLFLVIVAELSIITSQPFIANAVPAAPSPSCGVKARVEKIELKVLKRRDTVYDIYIITLDILEIKTENPVPPHSCEKMYPIGKKIETKVSPEWYSNNQFSEGNIIRGIIHMGGDEWSHGIFLYDAKAISESEQ